MNIIIVFCIALAVGSTNALVAPLRFAVKVGAVATKLDSAVTDEQTTTD